MTRVKFVRISCLLIFIKRLLINLTTSHLKTKILKKRQVVSFTMSKYSRGQPASSSSQPFQDPPPLWKSKRPFDNCFLSKEGNLFQHNFNSSKTHFPETVPMHQLKHLLVLNLFPNGEIGNFPLAGRLQHFLENWKTLTNDPKILE